MAKPATILRAVREAVSSRKTESAQRAAVVRTLARYGYAGMPEVVQGYMERGAIVRAYLFDGTPAGDLLLVTGPSIEPEVKIVKPSDWDETPAGLYGEFMDTPNKLQSKILAPLERAQKAAQAKLARAGKPAPKKKAPPKKKPPGNPFPELGTSVFPGQVPQLIFPGPFDPKTKDALGGDDTAGYWAAMFGDEQGWYPYSDIAILAGQDGQTLDMVSRENGDWTWQASVDLEPWREAPPKKKAAPKKKYVPLEEPTERLRGAERVRWYLRKAVQTLQDPDGALEKMVAGQLDERLGASAMLDYLSEFPELLQDAIDQIGRADSYIRKSGANQYDLSQETDYMQRELLRAYSRGSSRAAIIRYVDYQVNQIERGVRSPPARAAASSALRQETERYQRELKAQVERFEEQIVFAYNGIIPDMQGRATPAAEIEANLQRADEALGRVKAAREKLLGLGQNPEVGYDGLDPLDLVPDMEKALAAVKNRTESYLTRHRANERQLDDTLQRVTRIYEKFVTRPGDPTGSGRSLDPTEMDEVITSSDVDYYREQVDALATQLNEPMEYDYPQVPKLRAKIADVRAALDVYEELLKIYLQPEPEPEPESTDLSPAAERMLKRFESALRPRSGPNKGRRIVKTPQTGNEGLKELLKKGRVERVGPKTYALVEPEYELTDRPFEVGEILQLTAPDGLSVEQVNYRGQQGDQAVVVLNGIQLTVPITRLSRVKTPARADRGRPEPGKLYALTGGRGQPSIAGGSSWAESEVPQPELTVVPEPGGVSASDAAMLEAMSKLFDNIDFSEV